MVWHQKRSQHGRRLHGPTSFHGHGVLMMSSTGSPGHYWDLIFYKTYADLKAEASRTYINYLWWLFDPLLQLGVYYVVFAILFERGGPGYIFVLMIGIIFWRWFSESVSHGASTIMNGKGLMNQVAMPKWIFPMVCLLTDSSKFLVTLALLLLILFGLGAGWKSTMVALPLLVMVQFVLNAGCCMVASALVPFLPDLKHVITALLRALMFLSAVFFEAKNIPEQYLDLFLLNPVARLITEYREILIYERWPDPVGLLYVAFFGFSLFAAGLLLTWRFDKIYPRLN